MSATKKAAPHKKSTGAKTPHRAITEESTHPSALAVVDQLRALSDEHAQLVHRVVAVLDAGCPQVFYKEHVGKEWDQLHSDSFGYEIDKGTEEITKICALYTRAGIEHPEWFGDVDIPAAVKAVKLPDNSREKLEHVRDLAAAIQALGARAITIMQGVHPRAAEWYDYERVVREPVNKAASAITEALDGIRFLAIEP